MELKIPIHFNTETEFDMAMRAVMEGSELFDSHWQVITYLQQDLSITVLVMTVFPHICIVCPYSNWYFLTMQNPKVTIGNFMSVIWLQRPGLFIFTTLLKFCNLSRKKK